MFSDDSDRNTAGLSKQSVLICILGLGLRQVQKALAPRGYFPIQGFFKLSSGAGRRPLQTRLFFLADPSLRFQGGQGSQTYKHEAPQTAYRAPIVWISGAASADSFTICALSPLWKPLCVSAAFSPDNGVQRWTLPWNLYLPINRSAFKPSHFHCRGLGSDTSREMQRYLPSGKLPSTWLSSSA